MGKWSAKKQVDESDVLLDQQTSGYARIEPRFGLDADDLDLDEPVTKPPKYREAVIESLVGKTKKESDAEDINDVLMNAPSPRRRRVEVQTERPQRNVRRAQGLEQARPQGRRASSARPRDTGKNYWKWIRPQWILGLFVVAAAVSIYMFYEPLEKLLERPLKSVVVEGEFHFISKTRATELISQEIDNNFLRLDLMRLKQVLVSDPWVESVSLVRRWPDTLVVKILEQKPIARWDNGFLNQRGEIVRVKAADQLQGLPWLQGNEADAVEILQQYQDLSQLLRPRGLDISALKCDNKKSWRLTLTNNVEVVIGRDQVMEKMRRFMTVYDAHLNKVWADVSAVDVRYSNGIAVRWAENSESARHYLRANSLPGVAPLRTTTLGATH